jgi:diguanylate cyclase (GGDEF)-like protein
VTDPKIRRLPAVLDGPVARLKEQRAELAKEWLLRVLERASLDEIEQLPTERIVQELPDLISDVLDALASGEQPEPDDGFRERADRIAALRGHETVVPAELARDIAALQLVMIESLGRELKDVDPQVVVTVSERLATIFGAIQAAAVDELVRSRSEELEWLANTDALTGLYNVRYLQAHLRHLLGIQERYGHPFAVLVLDIDGLKRINDAYGHAAGDRALIGVAQAIRDSIRTIDTPVRMGGDEFCILAPHQTAAAARVLASRLAVAVEQIEVPEGSPIGVSVGVASCPQHGTEPERLLETADAAMYRSKAAGANVTVGDLPAQPETAVEKNNG